MGVLRSISLGLVLGLLSPSSFDLHRQVRADPPNIATIQASLESLRQGAGIRQIKYKSTVRIVKGSQNEFMDPPRLPGMGMDVPSEDIIVESPPMERIDDFPGNRSWSKGSVVQCLLEKDSLGNEKLVPYFEFSEAASDGIDIISISPKDRIDPKSIPRGIKVPVEVYRVKVKEDSKRQFTQKRLYPLFLSEGSLPAPDDPIAGRNLLSVFAPHKWRVAKSTVIDGRECPVILSVPTQANEYDEYTLRPDLHYVPCRWTRYYKGTPKHVVDIDYQASNGSRPRILSWKIQEYHPHGVLYHEESFAVESLERPNSVEKSLFSLKPEDGMLVMDLDHSQIHIAGNEVVSFVTPTDANAYLDRQNSSLTITTIFVICGILVVASGFAYRWARWRTSK